MKSEEFYISLVGEIFDGYTQCQIENRPVYIKHLSIRDQRYLHSYHEKYKQRAIERGVDTVEERTKQIVADGMWTDAEDGEISSLRFEIENLRTTLKGVFLPSQQDKIKQTLEQRREKLGELLNRKQEIIGKTADDYAISRSNDELLRFLLFKTPDLKENLYTEDEFSNLESWQILNINKIQEQVTQRVEDTNIQEAVLRPFFSMYLSFCEDAAQFYGQPTVNLSIYQLRIAIYGKMFFNIFQNTENIPDNIKEDPQKLMAFAEGQRNKDSGHGGVKQDADTSAVFGATKSDMQALNLESSANVSLAEEAAKHGGKLNMKQMMRLAGQDV